MSKVSRIESIIKCIGKCGSVRIGYILVLNQSMIEVLHNSGNLLPTYLYLLAACSFGRHG
jgi:hypothetical protein